MSSATVSLSTVQRLRNGRPAPPGRWDVIVGA
jgi:hypothetical protein